MSAAAEQAGAGRSKTLCNRYLRVEIAGLSPDAAILALGGIAHRAVLLAMDSMASLYPFDHGAIHCAKDRPTLFDSYHCSRYNTQTRRLTEVMFEAVFESIVKHLKAVERSSRSSAATGLPRFAPSPIKGEGIECKP